MRFAISRTRVSVTVSAYTDDVSLFIRDKDGLLITVNVFKDYKPVLVRG